MNYIIRDASPDDASEILDIYAKHILETIVTFETEVPSVEEFADRIKKIASTFPYYVCEADGKVVGYAYATKYRERDAYKFSVENTVYIADDFQNMGIGKALLSKLLDELKKRKFISVYSCISLPNEASISFHEYFGFKTIGVFHNAGLKFDKLIDIIWMEKSLI